MNILLDPQIVAAVVTVGLTAVAGVFGFLLREKMTQATPFIAITAVDGDFWRGSTRVTTPDYVFKALKKQPVLSSLPERARLSEIRQLVVETNLVKERAAEFLDILDQFRHAAGCGDTKTAQAVLLNAINGSSFNQWLTVLIGSSAITIPSIDTALPVQIQCAEERDLHGGCFAIGFPGQAITFGLELNRFALYKQGMRNFVSLIERFEMSKIADVFGQISIEMQKVLAIAKDAQPLLQEVMDKHSQWAARIYVANLGKTPFLIGRSGKLQVSDKSGAKFSVDCSLVNIGQDKDGDVTRESATSPLVVRAESDVVFEFLTRQVQADIDNGDALRLSFKNKSAVCWLDFPVEQVGFRRRTFFSTPRSVFAESSD